MISNTYVIVGRAENNVEVYAYVDSTYPMWSEEFCYAKKFYSIDSVKKWFEDCKRFLIHGKSSQYDVDISTVYIAQIHTTLEKVEEMVNVEKDSSTVITCKTIQGATLYASGRERYPWTAMEEDAIVFESEKDAEQWYYKNHNSLFNNTGYAIYNDTLKITTSTRIVKKLNYKNNEEE